MRASSAQLLCEIPCPMVCMCVQLGEEKVRIERPGGQPVWSLSWNPSRSALYTLSSPYITDFWLQFNGRFTNDKSSCVCLHQVSLRCRMAWSKIDFYSSITLHTTTVSPGKITCIEMLNQTILNAACCCHREDRHDLLTVCDWGKTLSYYHLSGRQVRTFSETKESLKHNMY